MDYMTYLRVKSETALQHQQWTRKQEPRIEATGFLVRASLLRRIAGGISSVLQHPPQAAWYPAVGAGTASVAESGEH